MYSGWKGHGKDAEAAYQKVIDEHGDDFRGYLAKVGWWYTIPVGELG